MRPISNAVSVLTLFQILNATSSFAGCIDEIDPANTTLESALTCLKGESPKFSAKNVPAGTIVAWYAVGKPIPAGWAICDGSQGTPDLRGKFLRGVGSLADIGEDENAKEAHSHSAAAQATQTASTAGTSHGNDDSVWTVYNHTHPVSVSPSSNVPPNFRIVYIMKK